ncbi:ATP-binding cassette sub-family C member 4-like [Leptopilina heterotoma]|uniref:ATP-binding cassette sub-family C member 4-like n=1 Tax=Leptopilina heterotoma TaxID=63436 RepID=UPI001CA7CD1E|nr:ATP-binding cassette sub-family C member 4-like [Leptopilina heterotoma]
MDGRKTTTNPNPREKASCISVLLWWWTVRLFKTGYTKILGTEDLFDPLKEDKSSFLGDRLEKSWNKEVKITNNRKEKISLLKVISRTFVWEYFLLGILQIFNELILRLGTPILLSGFLQYFRPKTEVPYQTALLFAGGICLFSCLTVISLNQSIYGSFHVGGRIRVAVCSLVYRKALKLSKTALGETAPGKIVNLVANDVNRFDLVSVLIHYMWSAPLSALIIAYLLYSEAGYAGLIGIAVVFVVVPIQSFTGKLSSIYRSQTAIKTDERVRLMDEIISGVQVIKMYAWEKPFCALVANARKQELKIVTKSSYIRGIYMTFNILTSKLALFATLLTMMLYKEPLTADRVFVFASYYSVLSNTMSSMFVRGIAEIAECLVAVRRLQYFLLYEEYQEVNPHLHRSCNVKGTSKMNNKENFIKIDIPFIDEDLSEDLKNKKNGFVGRASDFLKNTNIEDVMDEPSETWAVKLDNVTAKWEPGQSENTLEKVNLEIETGKLYMVIGMVGAGKSSLLSAILKEIALTEGSIRVKGGLSYAGQESWVFGSSVRQNILFGQPYDRQRYQRVVKACALLRDFKQFPQGDQTIVGDRGSSLSGGQKARINLARAVYRQADIYLFDDPLSAVDAHVGKHLFEECMKHYLSGKTRILATHQLQYIKGVDAIILLDQGKMQFYKNYQQLLQSHPEYMPLIAAETNPENLEDSFTERNILRRQFSTSSCRSKSADGGGDTDAEDEDEPKTVDELVEGTSKGTVKGSLFLNYFRSGANLFFAFLVLLLFILTQLAASLNDLYIPVLITAEEAKVYKMSNITINRKDDGIFKAQPWSQKVYIYVYIGIVSSIFVIGFTRSYAFYRLCMRASQRLHDMVFSALIRTGMRFFDTNPSGRILNRFSKDLGGIDELLPKSLLDAGQVTMLVMGSLIVTCIVNYYYIIPIILFGTMFYWIRKVYLKTSKNIKRLEGITRSPIFTHLNTTLNGLTTIRAFGAEEVLKDEFDKFQDFHTSSWFIFITTSSAFGFSLDVFSFIFTTLVTFSFLISSDPSSENGGKVGLAITQVMSMLGLIQWGMRQSAEVANQLMSVERVLEYVELPPEPNLRDKGVISKKKMKQTPPDSFVTPPSNWPNMGNIAFKNMYLRYSDDDPPVLKGLNLVIHPSEKVGIVGRTGAGKSSLIAALFRLAKIDGVIEIDNIDTGTVCLEDLRQQISIIPQDPVLFSGTIRRNLDPFEEFSDIVLWDVLGEVELKEAIAAVNGLDSRVSDRGSNFSVGQRQLICLARAILRNNRILMLDEATANVDPQTDALIQRTIRTKFASCTVLTVAHRLNTIMDSDKVLVMDLGQMAEFDHPHILLQNQFGQFTSLVKETGRAMFDQLSQVAEKAYLEKHKQPGNSF